MRRAAPALVVPAVLAGIPAVFLILLLLAPAAAAFTCNRDGFRNGAEQCDGSDLGGYRCTDLCFEGGTLGCNADCTFDTSGCCACGNGGGESACAEVCPEFGPGASGGAS